MNKGKRWKGKGQDTEIKMKKRKGKVGERYPDRDLFYQREHISFPTLWNTYLLSYMFSTNHQLTLLENCPFEPRQVVVVVTRIDGVQTFLYQYLFFEPNLT